MTYLVGTDVLHTGERLNSVHSPDEGVSAGEIGGSSSEGETDDGDQTGRQDGDGGSDGIGSDRERDVLETS
jgi:hypothetical protein